MLNDFIDTVKFNIIRFRNELNAEGKEISIDNLKNKLNGTERREAKKAEPTFMSYYLMHNEKFQKLVGIDFSKATLTRHQTSADHLERFITEYMGKSDIKISQVTYQFLNEYAYYFKTVRKCNHNTTMKYNKNLGTVIRMALADGLIDRNPFDKFKLTNKPVNRETLTEDEVDKLLNLELEEWGRLDRVRDMFVFCCYTGLAFIDVINLKMDHIIEDKDGVYWIKNMRYKTNAEFMIPLLPVTLKIIDKYCEYPQKMKDGSVLPKYSNQKYNSYLKDLASRVDIKKNLTSHIARHTFATIITLNEGVPLEVISKMLGHTNTRTTQIYAKVQQASIMHGMRRLMK